MSSKSVGYTRGYLCLLIRANRVGIVFSKKKSTWRIYVRHYDVDLNTIHSCDSVWWYTCIDAKFLGGDFCVPILYCNDAKRKLNRNRWSNEWDDKNRFLCVRNLISFT